MHHLDPVAGSIDLVRDRSGGIYPTQIHFQGVETHGIQYVRRGCLCRVRDVERGAVVLAREKRTAVLGTNSV